MAKRITPQEAKVMADELRANPRMSLRQLARKYGCSRNTAAAVLLRVEYEARNESARRREIPFRPCDPYECRDCKAPVSVVPCPACAARMATRKPAALVVAEDKKVESPSRQAPRPPSSIDWTAIPNEVLDWLRFRLEHMIDYDGRQASVTEAIADCSGEMFVLIESQAGLIGRERREKVSGDGGRQ